MIRSIMLGVVGLFVLVTGLSSFYTVDDGTVGVVSTFGEYNDNESLPGLHWKVPFVQTVMHKDVKMQTVNYKTGAIDDDASDGVISRGRVQILDSKNLSIGLELSVQFRPKAEEMSEILRNYGHNYFAKKINPIIRDEVRDVASGYDAETVAIKRQEIGNALETRLKERFEKLPFTLTKVALRNIILPPVVTQKITQVQEAKQEEQRLAMVEKQAEVNKKIAVIDAQKKAEVMIEEARGKAESIKAVADAQSKANKKVAASLTPLLVQQNQIERWDGVVPKYMLGGDSGTGILLNMNNK